MVRFVCEHCGRSVRVDESRAGSKGRCPHCGKVVMIPGAGGAGDDNVSALAAVLADDKDDTAAAPPPPPPSTPEPDLDEFDIVSPEAGAELETDCYPAIQSDEPSEDSAPLETPEPPRETPVDVPPRNTTVQNILLILVAITVVAVIGAMIYWMHFC